METQNRIQVYVIEKKRSNNDILTDNLLAIIVNER